MREIKFRAWDKTENKMARNVEELLFNSKGLYGVVLNHMGFEFRRRVKDVILEQYTGLKDKNGKKIFEGDVIKSDSGYRLIVKFGNHGYSAYTDCVELGFYCECVSEQAKRQQIREDFLFWVREEQAEIIGNIHEEVQE